MKAKLDVRLERFGLWTAYPLSLVGTDKENILSEFDPKFDSISKLREKSLELAKNHLSYTKSEVDPQKDNLRIKKWKEKQRSDQKQFYNKHKDLMDREIATNKTVEYTRNKDNKEISLELGIW